MKSELGKRSERDGYEIEVDAVRVGEEKGEEEVNMYK